MFKKWLDALRLFEVFTAQDEHATPAESTRKTAPAADERYQAHKKYNRHKRTAGEARQAFRPSHIADGKRFLNMDTQTA